MSLKIRMSRWGAKKRPFYRIVVADSRSPRDGRSIEQIGSYNPMLGKGHADRVKIDFERAAYWISKGAQPSERVAHFLHAAGKGEKPVVHKQTQQHLPRAKTMERLKAKEEAAKARSEAKAAESAAPAQAAAEAPAETPAEAPVAEAAAAETPAEA